MMIVTQVFFFPDENLGEKARADLGSQESWVQATNNRSGIKAWGVGPLLISTFQEGYGVWTTSESCPPRAETFFSKSISRSLTATRGQQWETRPRQYGVVSWLWCFPLSNDVYWPLSLNACSCLLSVFPLVCLFLNDLSNALYILDINPMSLRCWKYLHLVCY